jgi:hypothetical protein
MVERELLVLAVVVQEMLALAKVETAETLQATLAALVLILAATTVAVVVQE